MLKKATLAITLFFANASYAAENNLTFTTGVDYSSGKYGQSEKTKITYIPLTGKYETGQWTLKLTVPWLEIDGPGGVSGDGIVVITDTTNNKTTVESGLGDIVAGITYSAFQLDSQKIYIDIGAKVKIPTASKSKGLGTGETDYALLADVYKTFDQLTILGTIGYRVLGDPSGINLNNVWFATVGGAYKFDSRNSASFTVDLREPTTKSSTSLREYTLFYSHKFNDTYKLQTYLVTGDTTSSLDFGAGAMIGVSW